MVGESSSLVLDYLGSIADLKTQTTVCRTDRERKRRRGEKGRFPGHPPAMRWSPPPPLASLDSAAQDVFGRDARRPFCLLKMCHPGEDGPISESRHG